MQTSEKHYSVIRFYSEFSSGNMQETLAEDLSLEEARRLVETERGGHVPGEEIVVVDQLKTGLEAQVPEV